MLFSGIRYSRPPGRHELQLPLHGWAAGIAAAMAVKNDAVRFNEIDGTAVRREIRLPDKF